MPDVGQIVELSPSILYIVPVLVGLVQVAKTYDYVPSRWVPLFIIVASTLGAFLVTDLSWQATIVQGVAVGLMSIGSFSGVRSTVNG